MASFGRSGEQVDLLDLGFDSVEIDAPSDGADDSEAGGAKYGEGGGASYRESGSGGAGNGRGIGMASMSTISFNAADEESLPEMAKRGKRKGDDASTVFENDTMTR